MINPEQELCDLKERVNQLETTVNKSNFSGGLCWLAANEVKAQGWYWMKNNGEIGIVFIRDYAGKWCVENWSIAEAGEYYGPLPEPT